MKRRLTLGGRSSHSLHHARYVPTDYQHDGIRVDGARLYERLRSLSASR